MHRTFKGFLKAYCASLSGLRTTSLRRLCMSAATDAPRVAEPLFLLALEEGKVDYLLRLSKETWMYEGYELLARCAKGYTDAELFVRNEGGLPARVESVLNAFESQGDILSADRRIIALIRPRILGLLDKAGMTRYALCRALGLNMGNVYAYLAGDDTKVSRTTAHRMLEYLETA